MRLIDADAIPYNYTNERGVPMTREIDIQNMPTIEPEQQWIPVVKKPIEKGLMLVTYNDGDVDLLKQPTAYRRSDIVAWMPIEPWRGEETCTKNAK